MARHAQRMRLRIGILREILLRKETLFAAGAGAKESKLAGWAAVADAAAALGLHTRAASEATFMRDVWWQNVKKGVMEKIDKAKEPDCSVSIAKTWSQADDLVLSILDMEPPVMVVRLREPSGTEGEGELEGEVETNSTLVEVSDDRKPLPEDPLSQGDIDPLISSSVHVPKSQTWADCSQTKLKEPLPKDPHPQCDIDPIGSSRRHVAKNQSTPQSKLNERGQLELELLRLQVYTARLRARQLERALRLRRSAFTAALPQRPRPRARHRHHQDLYDSESSQDSFT